MQKRYIWHFGNLLFKFIFVNPFHFTSVTSYHKKVEISSTIDSFWSILIFLPPYETEIISYISVQLTNYNNCQSVLARWDNVLSMINE